MTGEYDPREIAETVDVEIGALSIRVAGKDSDIVEQRFFDIYERILEDSEEMADAVAKGDRGHY